jgi:hypothetical protein
LPDGRTRWPKTDNGGARQRGGCPRTGNEVDNRRSHSTQTGRHGQMWRRKRRGGAVIDVPPPRCGLRGGRLSHGWTNSRMDTRRAGRHGGRPAGRQAGAGTTWGRGADLEGNDVEEEVRSEVGGHQGVLQQIPHLHEHIRHPLHPPPRCQAQSHAAHGGTCNMHDSPMLHAGGRPYGSSGGRDTSTPHDLLTHMPPQGTEDPPGARKHEGFLTASASLYLPRLDQTPWIRHGGCLHIT